MTKHPTAPLPGRSPQNRAPGWALLLLLVVSTATAADFQGRVVHVIDGDSLIISVGGQRVNVRLKGIDAPELKQPQGIASRQSLIAICGGEIATVDQAGDVRNGQATGRVACNGTDAGAEQVRRGMAWARQALESSESLSLLQEDARAARRGLWARPAPVPPWEWRQRQ